jgi:hypothetical protein|tara:strand:- start:3711 stop:4733 length:1023 start_codon:yes stop_codon:yes gene_type:complete
MSQIFKYQKTCCECNKTFSTETYSEIKCSDCEKKIRTDKSAHSKYFQNSNRKETRQVWDKTIPDISYTYKKFTINDVSIETFDLLDNRRKVTKTHVLKLRKLLLKGKHFETPIIVNKVDGLKRLIDGNHRIEAIHQIIKRYWDFNIQILLIEYDNLSPEEEIQVFKLWNSGKPQSMEDFIKNVAHKLSFYAWVETSFPVSVSIYRAVDSITLYMLTNAIVAAKKGNTSGRGLMRDAFEEDLKELDQNDYNFAERWLKVYVETFGEPEWGNQYYLTSFFNATMYIAYTNRNRLIPLGKEMETRIKDKKRLINIAKLGTREATQELVGRMSKLLHNFIRSTK